MFGAITIEMDGYNHIVHWKNNLEPCINYKNKKIRVIVDNEEIYIINMLLPKANRKVTKDIIKDELSFRFKNLDKIMFDYMILKKSKKSIEVAVFCLNWNRGDFMNALVDKGAKIEGIYPLQLYMLKKFTNKIKDKSFYFIFLYEKSLYFIVAINKYLVMNKVYKKFNNIDEKIDINQFKDKVNILYYANIDKNNLSGFMDEEINFVDLGHFQHADIFKSY